MRLIMLFSATLTTMAIAAPQLTQRPPERLAAKCTPAGGCDSAGFCGGAARCSLDNGGGVSDLTATMSEIQDDGLMLTGWPG